MNRGLSVALVASLAVAGSAFGVSIGDKAPSTNVKMKSVDGSAVSIADVAGKQGTLVVFSCNHCPFVKAWQGRIASVGNAAKTRGIGVIIINSNDPTAYPEDSYAEMQKRSQQLGFAFPYVVDATSDVARAFGATHTPEAFLFDKDGKLVYHGAIADQVAAHYLQDAIDAALAGKAVPVAETKAIGCSIKFRGKA